MAVTMDENTVDTVEILQRIKAGYDAMGLDFNAGIQEDGTWMYDARSLAFAESAALGCNAENGYPDVEALNAFSSSELTEDQTKALEYLSGLNGDIADYNTAVYGDSSADPGTDVTAWIGQETSAFTDKIDTIQSIQSSFGVDLSQNVQEDGSLSVAKFDVFQMEWEKLGLLKEDGTLDTETASVMAQSSVDAWSPEQQQAWTEISDLNVKMGYTGENALLRLEDIANAQNASVSENGYEMLDFDADEVSAGIGPAVQQDEEESGMFGKLMDGLQSEEGEAAVSAGASALIYSGGDVKRGVLAMAVSYITNWVKKVYDKWRDAMSNKEADEQVQDDAVQYADTENVADSPEQADTQDTPTSDDPIVPENATGSYEAETDATGVDDVSTEPVETNSSRHDDYVAKAEQLAVNQHMDPGVNIEMEM